MFKWATRECLNGEAGGVCVFVEGVGIRQQECVVMHGGFFSTMWCLSVQGRGSYLWLWLFSLGLIFPSVQPLSVKSRF